MMSELISYVQHFGNKKCDCGKPATYDLKGDHGLNDISLCTDCLIKDIEESIEELKEDIEYLKKLKK